jgi:hypothetical protein
VLLGSKDPAFIALSRTAGWALGLSFGAFGLACALSYLKHYRKTLESATRERRPGWFREGAVGLLPSLVLQSPEERAVGMFFSKTIRSSPRHRAVLVNGLAVGAALVMLSIVASRRNLQALDPANTYFLAQSLLLVFVLLAGLRIVVDVPAALESNWVFRVTESAQRGRYIAGLKKTILVQWFLPLAALIFLAHLWLWKDGRTALLHAVFCLDLSGLGLVAALAGLEKSLLDHPGRFWVFLPVSAILWAFLWIRNARFLKEHPLIYEEEPEPAMVGFPEDI